MLASNKQSFQPLWWGNLRESSKWANIWKFLVIHNISKACEMGAFSNCFILPKATLAWQKNGQVYSSLWGKLINKPQQTSCPADMHCKMMIFSKVMEWLRVWKLGDTHLLTKIHCSHCCIVQQAYQYLNKLMQGYTRPLPMPSARVCSPCENGPNTDKSRIRLEKQFG